MPNFFAKETLLSSVCANPYPTCNNDYTVGLLNVRSLSASGRVTRVLSEVLSHSIDFLFLTETWHKEPNDSCIRELTIDGYQNFFRARPDGKHGGGLGVLFLESFSFSNVDVPMFLSFEHLTLTVSFCMVIRRHFR